MATLHHVVTVTNIRNFISIILEVDDGRYTTWFELFKIHCRAHDVIQYVIPSEVSPPKGKEKAQEDPTLTKSLDSTVLPRIYGTISPNFLTTIISTDSIVVEAWKALEHIFVDSKPSRALYLENKFNNIKLENFPNVSAYCQELKTLSDQLTNVDAALIKQGSPRLQLINFDAALIKKATNGFSQSRLLGRGGQGTVYKGFLTDGTIVAIKKSHVIDKDRVERFVNELFILAQINHRNIVKLLGCCLEYEVPLLVYEYLSNGTLSEHLHDGAEVSKVLWKDCIRVARDVAGALAYLHSYASPAIFHRDVKPYNILLDEKYRAVVCDFGLLRSIPLSKTHLTTKIEGLFGYLDPEYFRCGQLTEKSDVYAFGVVLTSLLTRKKVVFSTNGGQGLVSHFQFLVKQNRVLENVDKQVLDQALRDDILLVTKLAKTCMKKKKLAERPSMKEVVMDLDKLKVVQAELPR